MPSSKPVPRRNLSVAGLKKALKGRVDLRLNGWEILGDIMVVELGNGYTKDEKRLIGEKIIELHPKAKTVINRKAIKDEFRQPHTEVLAGTRTETIYKEEGCLFKLDPAKVMFSFGNKEERKRMGLISCKDEIIIDMFACVGQFTIPIAKHSQPKKVYAVEKNPVAFEYLKENIRRNKLTNVEAVHGDCRDVCPKGVADRVVMGYLFETEKFLKTAIEALDERGIIHYHFVCDSSKLVGEKKRIIKAIEENAKKAKISKTVKVKSYAPKMYHWALDIEVCR